MESKVQQSLPFFYSPSQGLKYLRLAVNLNLLLILLLPYPKCRVVGVCHHVPFMWYWDQIRALCMLGLPALYQLSHSSALGLVQHF